MLKLHICHLLNWEKLCHAATKWRGDIEVLERVQLYAMNANWHWKVWWTLEKICRSKWDIFQYFSTDVDSIWASGLVTNVCFYICTWQLVISSLVVHNVLGSVLPFFRTRLYNSLGCDSDHHFWLIVFLVRRHCTPSMTGLSMGWKLK